MGTTNQQALLAQLKRLPVEDAIALIEAIKDKRLRDEFVKFWHAQGQQEAIFHQWTPDIKTFGIVGGNRSGKTELGAFIDIAWCLGKRYFEGEPAYEYVKDLPIPDKPNTVWVVGLDNNVLWNVIWGEKFLRGRTHAGFVPLDQLEKPPSEAEPIMYFKNGSILVGKSAESGREKFQSASVDLVHIDEEPEVEIYDECYQRTSDCAGKLLLTLTPLTDVASGIRTPWVFDLHTDFKNGVPGVKFAKLSVLDNPWVPDDEKKRLIQKWEGHPEERARLYGEFIQRSGLVYNLWNPKVHKVKRFMPPRDWPCAVIIDPAPSGPTAALQVRVDPHGNYFATGEYKEPNLVVSDHAKNILMRFAGVPVDI